MDSIEKIQAITSTIKNVKRYLSALMSVKKEMKANGFVLYGTISELLEASRAMGKSSL